MTNNIVHALNFTELLKYDKLLEPVGYIYICEYVTVAVNLCTAVAASNH